MALGIRCSSIYQRGLPSFFVRFSPAAFSFPRAKFFHSTSSIMTEEPTRSPPPPMLPQREIGRQSRRFLYHYGAAPAWGFVIYRTVYTPESDKLWPGIMEKLEAYIHKSIWYDVNNAAPDAPLDPEPNRQVCALLKNVIMNSKDEFDGATIPDIQKHFAKFADIADYLQGGSKSDGALYCSSEEIGNDPMVNDKVCLLVDQDVLEAVRDAPDPSPKAWDKSLYVKAVDGCYDPPYDPDLDENHPRYSGWAFVNAFELWDLYEQASVEWDLGSLISSDDRAYNADTDVFRWHG